MKITDFNKQYKGEFRFAEIEPYTRQDKYHIRRFNLEQWCQIAERWFRMLMPGRWDQRFGSENKTPVSNDECYPVYERLLDDLENIRPVIIVCEEKHGTQYFSASNTEDIGRAALHLLKERNSQGYYPKPDDLPEKPQNKPEEMVDPQMIKFCKEQWKRYDSVLESLVQEREFYKSVQKALKENDYVIAAGLLEDRDGCEYEGFVIETLTEVE